MIYIFINLNKITSIYIMKLFQIFHKFFLNWDKMALRMMVNFFLGRQIVFIRLFGHWSTG